MVVKAETEIAEQGWTLKAPSLSSTMFLFLNCARVCEGCAAEARRGH